MTSGDRNAVYIMYRAIISAAPRLGFSLPAVGKQLQREYGIQINEEDNEERKLDPVIFDLCCHFRPPLYGRVVSIRDHFSWMFQACV